MKECQEKQNCTKVCDNPLLLVTTDFLWAAWRAIYWTMFNLTFFVIPIIQGYIDSGYFTPWERFKKAIRRNVVYYVGLGIVGLILLVWIGIQRGWKNSYAIHG